MVPKTCCWGGLMYFCLFSYHYFHSCSFSGMFTAHLGFGLTAFNAGVSSWEWFWWRFTSRRAAESSDTCLVTTTKGATVCFDVQHFLFSTLCSLFFFFFFLISFPFTVYKNNTAALLYLVASPLGLLSFLRSKSNSTKYLNIYCDVQFYFQYVFILIWYCIFFLMMLIIMWSSIFKASVAQYK